MEQEHGTVCGYIWGYLELYQKEVGGTVISKLKSKVDKI